MIYLFYYREHCLQCCQIDQEKSIKVYAKARLEVCTCKFGAYPQIQGICVLIGLKFKRIRKINVFILYYYKALQFIFKLHEILFSLISNKMSCKSNLRLLVSFETHLLLLYKWSINIKRMG